MKEERNEPSLANRVATNVTVWTIAACICAITLATTIAFIRAVL